jgi:hypothetical protein
MTGYHDPNHPNHIFDPCRWVYASGHECGLSAEAHRQNSRLEHRWSAVPIANPRCIQCFASIRGWGHSWPTGAVSCSDCYYADWGFM